MTKEIMVQFPYGLGDISFLQIIHQSGAHPASYLMGTVDDFPRDKINVWAMNVTVHSICCQC
jgi:hypothetical protein